MTRIRLQTGTTTALRTTALCALVVLGAACGGAEEAIEEPELGAVVVTQWVDGTELFLEYPFLVAGQQTGNWAIHLTHRDGFEPIRAGTLHVRFSSGGTAAEAFTVDAPLRDGIFLLDPVIARAGTYQVELILESAQVESRHVVSDVLVHGSEEEALAHAAAEELAGVSFLKEQQWVIPFAVHPAEEHPVQARQRPLEVLQSSQASCGAQLRQTKQTAQLLMDSKQEPRRRSMHSRHTLQTSQQKPRASSFARAASAATPGRR